MLAVLNPPRQRHSPPPSTGEVGVDWLLLSTSTPGPSKPDPTGIARSDSIRMRPLPLIMLTA